MTFHNLTLSFCTMGVCVCGGGGGGGRGKIDRSKEHSTIAEQYDKLVAVLRSRNPNCKVLLSKIAPRGDVDVKMINDIIGSVAQACDIVKNYRAFFDKRGQLITRFYNTEYPVHPSNSGKKQT